MSSANDISNASIQKNIENATKSKNPLANFPDLMQYQSSVDQTNLQLYCKVKNDMDVKTLKWAFKLAERNVGQFYKTCSLGWQPKIKQADLNKNWARYLVAVNTSKNPVAYSMFRFDHDYGASVLYCYEIQVEKEFQRKGLGKFMMNILEKCAQYWNMEKIILTILKNNRESLNFFEKLGYQIDETSPGFKEKADYEILSKRLL